MSEVVAESVQTQSDGTLWAITVQTVDSISWKSLDVVGPFKRLAEAVEAAERLFKGHTLLLV